MAYIRGSVLALILVVSLGFAKSYQTTEALRLRTQPAWSSSVIGVIPNRATVNATSCKNAWCLVTYKGSTGYLTEQYLIPLSQQTQPNRIAQTKIKRAKTTRTSSKPSVKRSSKVYKVKNAKQKQYFSSSSGVSSSTSSGAPAGATAQCVDGSYSFSLHHQGTCSHHGGVATWL